MNCQNVSILAPKVMEPSLHWVYVINVTVSSQLAEPLGPALMHRQYSRPGFADGALVFFSVLQIAMHLPPLFSKRAHCRGRAVPVLDLSVASLHVSLTNFCSAC